MKLYRLHIKPTTDARQELINMCLKSSDQILPLGWSYLYNEYEINDFDEYISAYLNAEKQGKQKRGTPLTFANLKIDDLVWTRDLDGIYYLCRVIDTPKTYNNANNRKKYDLGAFVSVEALKIGMSVPGTIIGRFSSTSSRRPAIEAIKDKAMVEYSKFVFNRIKGVNYYEVSSIKYDLFEMLDAWDLEELIIDYIQIKYDYYLSKNSVSKNDTTIKVECELLPRKDASLKSAVVQVKKKRKNNNPVDYYDSYIEDENKTVFLFYADENYDGYRNEIIKISKKEVLEFVEHNIQLLPNSIKYWASICGIE